MNIIDLSHFPEPKGRVHAFTLVEIMVAAALLSVMFLALFGGISYGFTVTRLARENVRATQIILEKMEGVRLYTFDQLVSSNMFSTDFTAPYYPLGMTNGSAGLTFYGKFTLSDPNTGAIGYNDNLRLVTVSVIWTNSYSRSQVVRRRQMQTLVARYGVQNYTFYQ
jgi:prepilin-type N-terminal cleavage/methylation domain-containing protein